MKRTFWIILLLIAFALPVSAQPSADPVDWIPADFSGVVRINLGEDQQQTLNSLNAALFVESVLQPPRLQLTARLGYDDLFPLTTFDLENASFSKLVLPWLDRQIIFAYHTLDAQFQADPAETVLILPTQDAFAAASALSPVIKGQDLLKQATYRQMTLYLGDKIAFAFTPRAVLVGPEALIEAVIDTQSGSAPALSADPIYQQVTAHLSSNGLVTAYAAKDAAARALSVLTSGSDAATPLLTALSQALASDDPTPERLLFGSAIDGLGVSVTDDRLKTQSIQAQVVYHTTRAPKVSDAAFDPAVLDLIPRSAMIVESGADVSAAATDLLYGLPLLNFGGTALTAFPINPSAASQQLSTPTAADLTAAVSTFLTALKPTVDLQADLLDNLDGSYALALLPRPNDPLPAANIPFDLLLVAQTASPEAAQTAQASASKLLATFTAPLQPETLEQQSFNTLRLPGTGEPLVRIGAVDNLLVIGTGASAQLALDARRGDNRLSKQDRWQALTAAQQMPYFYLDVSSFYNTFLPNVGATGIRPISQLGLHSSYAGSNLFTLDLAVLLTQQ